MSACFPFLLQSACREAGPCPRRGAGLGGARQEELGQCWQWLQELQQALAEKKFKAGYPEAVLRQPRVQEGGEEEAASSSLRQTRSPLSHHPAPEGAAGAGTRQPHHLQQPKAIPSAPQESSNPE
ncbi:UNVERIFIED_CONTAM: hypothetical protein K2H54_074438 [Gekko kuhli]